VCVLNRKVHTRSSVCIERKRSKPRNSTAAAIHLSSSCARGPPLFRWVQSTDLFQPGRLTIQFLQSFYIQMTLQRKVVKRPSRATQHRQGGDILLAWVLQLSLASLYAPLRTLLVAPLGRVLSFQIVCAQRWGVLVKFIVQLATKAAAWIFQPAFGRESRIHRILRAWGLGGAKRIHLALGESCVPVFCWVLFPPQALQCSRSLAVGLVGV